MFDDPISLGNWFVRFVFVIDLLFGTVGYICTFRPLDTHIRSANPYAAAWVTALLCYPPTNILSPFLHHGKDGREWSQWLHPQPVVLTAVAILLAFLALFYVWSTVAFGLRVSNLTNRGILTHGPYAFSRHPAYLSKNMLWWLSSLPMLAMGTAMDAVRVAVVMVVVSTIYYCRARTEERHLLADPTYREYSAWMDCHAPLPRLMRCLRRVYP